MSVRYSSLLPRNKTSRNKSDLFARIFLSRNLDRVNNNNRQKRSFLAISIGITANDERTTCSYVPNWRYILATQRFPRAALQSIVLRKVYAKCTCEVSPCHCA